MPTIWYPSKSFDILSVLMRELSRGAVLWIRLIAVEMSCRMCWLLIVDDDMCSSLCVCGEGEAEDGNAIDGLFMSCCHQGTHS